MKRLGLFITAIGFLLPLQAQYQHLDFLGAGHDNEVKVSTSSSNGQKTVDGFPIQNTQQLKEASRFLAQATFGADYATIEMTAAMGYEAWLDEQFQLPRISHTEEMVRQAMLYTEEEEEEEDFEISPYGPISSYWLRPVWATNVLSSPDLLRQRMAFNLSQIFVVNDNSDLIADFGQSISIYYDSLSANAFTNYRKLLQDVTYSPMMGNFLSHYNNPKEDTINNIRPDENYAREIMQLFSIGLWQLEADGRRKRNSEGQFIPTYNNADIKEFAQVFTGLGDGSPNGRFYTIDNPPDEDEGEFNEFTLLTTPMRMYNDFHDTSSKRLLNGVILPAGQSGDQDIAQTLDHLSFHPNTAPFISKALIQFFTTSNPSPNYVRDVAAVFNPATDDNFQDVLKAILLHPEARNCQTTSNYTFGKLREPIVRNFNFWKAFHFASNEYGDYPYDMYCFNTQTGQTPLSSPSVFNFFLPDYQPQGPIGQNYLVAPEFQILNSTNAIGMLNIVNDRVIRSQYIWDECPSDELPEDIEDIEEEEELFEESEEHFDTLDGPFTLDFSEELALTNQAQKLVERLDILLANGGLSDSTKDIIINAINQLETAEGKLRMAIYLILISPDYAILK